MESQTSIRKVLIVEDELILSIVLEKLIENMGYEVIGKAGTGKMAIEMALDLNPDIITMDISLADEIDGIRAVQCIQQKRMIPVIYISGNSDDANYNRAKTTNFIDFVLKPVRKKDLAESFEKASQICRNLMG